MSLAENVAHRERIGMFYREAARSSNPTESWNVSSLPEPDALQDGTAQTTQHYTTDVGDGLNLHRHLEPVAVSPMMNWEAIGIDSEQFSWLAREEMRRQGISPGDVYNSEMRIQGLLQSTRLQASGIEGARIKRDVRMPKRSGNDVGSSGKRK